jgi:hypothetical protein
MRIARFRGLPLVIVFVACGGGGPPAWDQQPIETMSGTVGGTAFTIDLPKGCEKSKVDSKYDVEFNYHHDGRVYAPTVSISKDDKKQKLDAKATVLHKDQTADGWVYAVENTAYPNKEDYIIRCEKFVGDAALAGSVRIFPLKKGETTKELIPAAEKLCLSLKAK